MSHLSLDELSRRVEAENRRIQQQAEREEALKLKDIVDETTEKIQKVYFTGTSYYSVLHKFSENPSPIRTSCNRCNYPKDHPVHGRKIKA